MRRRQVFSNTLVSAMLCGFLMAVTSTPTLADSGWEKLSKETFGEVYQNSMADGLFSKPHDGFMPAVQYLQRPLNGNFQTSAHALVREILTGFGEDLKSITAKDYSAKVISSGLSGNLEAYQVRLTSNVWHEPTATCIVIVKDGKVLRAIYARAFTASFSMNNCQAALLDLAGSPILYK